MVIDGQMDEYARPPFRDATKTPDELRLTVDVSNCLFWAIDTLWIGQRVVDSYPSNVTLIDNQFIDNYGLVSSAWNIGLYGGTFPEGSGILGRSYHSYIRNEISGLNSPNSDRWKFEIGAITDYIYRKHLYISTFVFVCVLAFVYHLLCLPTLNILSLTSTRAEVSVSC